MFVPALDPGLLPDADVAEAFALIAELQKLAGAASVRLAARYEEVGAWKRSGARSPEDDIARRTGTSTARARTHLDTSRKVRTQSKTDDALRHGRLSPDQADAVASGTAASPEDEDDLLDAAGREPLHQLKRRAAEARAKADRDREATRARHHAARRVRRWVDEEGMYNLHLRGPGEWGAEIDASLKADIDRAFADARHAGRFEPVEAYTADVVRARLLGTDATSSRSQAVRPERKVIALVDLAALNRGHALAGETSILAGVGPVSVSAIRAMLADAFVSVVFTDGVDVRNVTHLGRQVTAHQRSALEARGYQCEYEGCGSTHQLEIDHITGWSLTRTTELDDLCWLCSHHHREKSRKRLRLVGGVGARHFAPPPPSANDPPPGVTVQDDLFTTAR